MNKQSYPYRLMHRLLTAALLILTASCSWVGDDLQECPPTELRLRFEYDYNMLFADLFNDHVGCVCVYVFDENDKLVTRRVESEETVLEDKNYEMVFSDLQPGKYRFVTLALQDDEEEIMRNPGAKFRYPVMNEGDPIEKLEIKLERSEARSGDSRYVEHEGRALDTLWTNRTDNRAELKLQQTTTETVNLLRHTNHVSVTLRQVDRPADIDCNDFDIRVTDRNGWLNYDGSPHEDDLLTYTPYAVWNTVFKDDAENVVQRAAHADLSLPRLIYHKNWQDNARLTIFNKKTGKLVADINLPDYLAQGRNSGELSFDIQEFLDREFDYKLDFFLKGDTWEYVELRISVLDWAIRIQNIGL